MLVYAREPCARADTEAMFFLHLDPVDINDLPDHRKQYGFDNLDFDFEGHGMRIDGRCMATVALPGYDIIRIRTSQYTIGKDWIWGGSFDVAEPADEGKAAP